MPAGTIPFVPLVGETVKEAPLQVTAVIALISGTGFKVTITEKAAPGQLPELGETIYVTVWAVLVLLSSFPLIIVGLFEAVAPPVTEPVKLGRFQVYTVPAGTIPLVMLVGVTTNGRPLQTTVVMVLISAVGGIVTVTVNGLPSPQLNILGVTI